MDTNILFWCTMIVTIFEILSIIYVIQVYFFDNFNPIGKEFAALVIIGFYAIIEKK